MPEDKNESAKPNVDVKTPTAVPQAPRQAVPPADPSQEVDDNGTEYREIAEGVQARSRSAEEKARVADQLAD